MERIDRSEADMDQGQNISFESLRLMDLAVDTTSLPHGVAEIRHREAHAICLSAGWIEAAEYHRRVAAWHSAAATAIA